MPPFSTAEQLVVAVPTSCDVGYEYGVGFADLIHPFCRPTPSSFVRLSKSVFKLKHVSELLLQSLFDDAERRPLTVSELNAEVRGVLERQFSNVWVEGEVVNFIQAASGHWYFNLNDGTSQIKCVCWKGTNYRIRFKPQNGITVRVRGRLTLYEARGDFQLSVESLEPSGEGALAAAYEQIKAKLDARRACLTGRLKRPIPFFPRRVGGHYFSRPVRRIMIFTAF